MRKNTTVRTLTIMLAALCILSCSDYEPATAPHWEIDGVEGDLNLNGLGYEIADAVMFTNYFIEGTSVFRSVDSSMAASDINRDGKPLTVSDLVYLLRVVVGDAISYPKLTPMETSYSLQNGVVSVDHEMGAAHVVLEGDAQVQLLADNMEMKTGMIDGNMNAIIYSSRANTEFAGNFLVTDAQVLSIEFATYDGQPVVAENIQSHFKLYQNYPNPFHRETMICFDLPHAATYKAEVISAFGEVLTTLQQQSEAGHICFTFDGADYPSGLYFYRVRVGDESVTKQMWMIRPEDWPQD